MRSGQKQAEPILPPIICYNEALFEVTDQARLGGSALISCVFRKKDDDSLWVGKSNVNDSELSSKSEACREKIASDIYRYYGVTVPETALARLPIQLPEWATTFRDLGEMVKGGRKHTVYHLSKIIAGFHTFGSIPQFRAQGDGIILDNPEQGALNAIGLGHVLAVAKFIFDVDVIGGSGGNIGYQVMDGEAKVIKIDPGESFNLDIDLGIGERSFCVATQAPDAVIEWACFPKQVKREFLETLQLIVSTPDEIIARFFMREGAESLLFHRDAEILREMPKRMIKRRDDLRKSFAKDLENVEGRRPANFLQTRRIEQRDILVTLASIRPRAMQLNQRLDGMEAAAVGGGGAAAAEPVAEPLPKVNQIKTMADGLGDLANQEQANLVSALEQVWELGPGDEQNKQREFHEANGFEVLSAFVQHAEKEIRFAALGLILQAIKNNEKNQDHFLNKQGLSTIRDCLAFASGRVQWASLQLMLVYTHRDEAKQVRFREAGVLPALLGVLKNQHESIRASAIQAVVDYAICNDNTPNADNLFVIWPLIDPAMLVTLLKDSERVSYCALTLVGIFINSVEKQKDSFVQAGGIVELVRLLGSRDAKFLIKAADCLRYLSRMEGSAKPNVANQNSIREDGGIVALLALLKNADANVRRQASAALYYVVDGNKVNQDMIRAAGGIKKIVDLLQDPDSSVLQHAVTALHFVTHNHHENLLDSQKSGALEALKKVRATQSPDRQKHIDRVMSAFELNLKAAKKAQALGGGGAKEDDLVPKELGQIISYADLRYEKKVGEGAFGCVFVGTWKGQKVAIKELKAQGVPQEALQDMLQEGLVMMQLRHKNVMHVHGICPQPGHYGLIMQFVPGGSLEDLLKKQTTELTWQRRVSIALRISRGMTYLHTNKILHRDLKSPNILLEANDNPRITDFGLVKVKTATATMQAQKDEGVGTIIFMAPELFERKATFRSASDVYSFAMVLFEIAARRMPWVDVPGLTQGLLMLSVCAGKRPAIPEATPPRFVEIMQRCWAQRIEDRPNFERIEADLTECRTTLAT